MEQKIQLKDKIEKIKDLTIRRDFLYEKRAEIIKAFDEEMTKIKNEYYDVECLGLKLFNDISIGSTVLYTKKCTRKKDILIYGVLDSIINKKQGVFGLYEFKITDQNKKTHEILMDMPTAIKNLQKAGPLIPLSKILQNKL